MRVPSAKEYSKDPQPSARRKAASSCTLMLITKLFIGSSLIARGKQSVFAFINNKVYKKSLKIKQSYKFMGFFKDKLLAKLGD